jgi:beta-galactosidase
MGATYQWLDCNKNFEQIIGDTNRNFVSKKSGKYAVSISKNSCSINSDCFEVLKTNVSILDKLDFFHIYPNPTNGMFIVESSIKFVVKYEVLDITGKSILKGEFSENSNKIDFSEKETGIYILKIYGQSLKLIKN